jgi:hypothetical protein
LDGVKPNLEPEQLSKLQDLLCPQCNLWGKMGHDIGMILASFKDGFGRCLMIVFGWFWHHFGNFESDVYQEATQLGLSENRVS